MAIALERDVSGFLVRRDEAMARRARAEGAWPDRTVAQFAQQRYLEHPDRIQLADNDRALTCREIYEEAEKLSGALMAGGVAPGDVVSFQLPNWWEASVVNLAAAMVGAVVNPIVPIYRATEVSDMLNRVRAKVFFIPETFRNFDYAAMAALILPDLALRPEIVLVRGSGSRSDFQRFESLLSNASPLAGPRVVDADSVKMIMFTSGTTGRAKGVLHSHNTIHADGMKMVPAMDLTPADTTFSPSPITHVSGYLWTLNVPWLADIPAVTLDIWQPERAFDLLKAHRCSFMLGATPFLQGLLEVARVRGDHLPDLRQYLCGGAAVPPSLIYEAAEQFTNCIPWRNFGATETPTMTRGPACREDVRLGAETDGRLHFVDVKIVDLASGTPLPPSGEGEILAREASMALGYLDVADNADAYDADGFFRMGDIGKIIEGDHILITGRKKDLIIRAGENISAKEIEDVLTTDPLIADVAVVSMPNPATGEAICAFVVPEEGAAPDMGHVSRIVAEAGLAKQKTPEHLVLVRELPRTASGKVRKDLLRAEATRIATVQA